MREYEIILGKSRRGEFLRFGGSEHVALHARSGAGKSSSFTIPNCFAWQGSLVVLDVKREAFNATAGHRAAMGQRIFLFDPAAEDGRSHRWDPFAAVRRESPERFDQIARMGFQLFPEHYAGPGNASADRFWEPAGRAAFVAVATLLSETPDEALTMTNVLRVFTRGDGIEWLARKIEGRRNTNRHYSRVVVDGVSDYINGDIRQVDGIRKTVTTRLQVWHNPRIAAATESSDFDVRDLRRQPMTIYVAVAPGDIPRMAPLLRLFFDQLINLNTVKTPQQDRNMSVQTLVLLDEFARLGRVDCLSHAAQFVRGYGMRLAFVVQNKAQLRELYGQHGAADIFDNLGVEVVFGTGDLELAQELEKRLGDSTVNVITQNRPRWFSWFNLARQTDAEHPHRRPLLLAQEVLQMPAGELIILRPGMRPIRARKIQWWSEQEIAERQLDAPEIPTLLVDIAMDDGSTQIVRKVPRAMSGLTRSDIENC
jgi:type IV secretion system protein VirD4